MAVATFEEIRQKKKVPSFEELRGVTQFDPEGSGYDYETAKEFGGKPDETGHWGSLDPRSGMLLKGIKHESIQKTIDEEKRRGSEIVKGKDGRYYSRKTVPSFEEIRGAAKPTVGITELPLQGAPEPSPPPEYSVPQPHDPVEPPRMEEPGVRLPFVRPYMAMAESFVPGVRRKLAPDIAERVEKLPWQKKWPEAVGHLTGFQIKYGLASGILKGLGWKAPVGLQFIDRFMRVAPPLMVIGGAEATRDIAMSGKKLTPTEITAHVGKSIISMGGLSAGLAGVANIVGKGIDYKTVSKLAKELPFLKHLKPAEKFKFGQALRESALVRGGKMTHDAWAARHADKVNKIAQNVWLRMVDKVPKQLPIAAAAKPPPEPTVGVGKVPTKPPIITPTYQPPTAPTPAKPGLEAIAEHLPKPVTTPLEAAVAPPVAVTPKKGVKVPSEAITEAKPSVIAPKFKKGDAGQISPNIFKDIQLPLIVDEFTTVDDVKTVDLMIKEYREGNRTELERPIAVMPMPDGGLHIFEGSHRAAAAKKLGIDIPFAVVAQDSTGVVGMSSTEIDGLAARMYSRKAVKVAPEAKPPAAEAAKPGPAEKPLFEEPRTYKTKAGKIVEAPIRLYGDGQDLTLAELHKMSPQEVISVKRYSAKRGGVARGKIKVGNLILPEIPAAEAAKPAAKEPWEMKHTEYLVSKKSGDVFDLHEQFVKAAITQGKPVPLSVLEEYKSEKWAQEALAKGEKAKVQKPIVKKKTPIQIAKETPAERKYFTDLLLDERQRLLGEAAEYSEQFNVEQLRKEYQPRLDVIDKDLRARGYNPSALPTLKKSVPEQYEYKPIEKPKGKPGFADVTPILEAHKTFMRVLEPSKAVERKLGKEAAAAVIKGIHATDVARVEFEQTELPKKDKVIAELEKYLDRFPDKDLDNLMLSRGNPVSVNAQLIKRDAINKLPKELRSPRLIKAIQHIADFNYKYLQSVVGDDINRVADYFYGIYKDSKKVDKFLDYWRTTKRFTKEKKLPTYADAKSYGLEIKDPNPVRNLKSEYVAIAHLEGMNWLKDELMRTGESKFIDNFIDAPVEWDKVQDPAFSGLRVEPDLAKLINNLIATNKLTKIPILKTLRDVNNFLRTVKFIGSAFHLLSVAKQSVADSGYLGFYKIAKFYRKPGERIPFGVKKGTAIQGITSGFRKNDPIFITPFYKRYLRNGGGHRYSVESESRRAFNKFIKKFTASEQKAIRVGALPLRIPTGFVNWMFNSYIPKVKYAKTQMWYDEQAKKLGRELTDSELQEIIKEGQNFYGMMNERLFGRSGTVTTALRFYFLSPGYAEGNYRTMIKAVTQWGGKEGFRASRSRSNIVNSLILTGMLATVGTMIMTGEPPKKPETTEDVRDLFKIDTGKRDDKDRRIMIDLMTYDKDYWQVAFNVLKGRPDVAVKNAVKRIGGMKAPTADMIVDLALISMGRAVYDWKGDRITEITDPFLRRAMKLAVHEVKKLEPISVSVFKQSRRREIDTTIAAMESLLGVRPTKTEKDKREQEIISRIFSLKGQQEELYQYLGTIKNPRTAIGRYNRTVNDILESKFVPNELRKEWKPKLLIDVDRLLQNKAHFLTKVNLTEEEIQRTVKYLRNFGLTQANVENYLEAYWNREKKITVGPLERHPVIGKGLKRERLKERMVE